MLIWDEQACSRDGMALKSGQYRSRGVSKTIEALEQMVHEKYWGMILANLWGKIDLREIFNLPY